MRGLAFHVLRTLLDLVVPAREGAKGIVFTDDGRVLLVWHSYVDGWQFPGGSPHRGESTADACVRELWEETGVVVEGGADGLVRLGRYRWGKGAVVAFVARRWRQEITSNMEIARLRFFPVDDLPKGTTPATRRRLDEWFGRSPVTGRW